MQYTIIYYSITYNSICSSWVSDLQIIMHCKNTNGTSLYTTQGIYITKKNRENKRYQAIYSDDLL